MNEMLETCKAKFTDCCKAVAGYSGMAFQNCLHFHVSQGGASVDVEKFPNVADKDVADRFNEFLVIST